uniref:PRORP domain-containing protein n=1 Tax=Macrostomum lignano TaxID=282301 RepID=A0A1I8HHL7_9PLAT
MTLLRSIFTKEMLQAVAAASRLLPSVHIRCLSQSGSGQGQQPSFEFLPPLLPAVQEAQQSLSKANERKTGSCSNRLLAELRNRYANFPCAQPQIQLTEALSAAADCSLDAKAFASLRQFLLEEAERWRLGRGGGSGHLWLALLLRLLTSAGAASGQLFHSLASHGLAEEPLRSCPTSLLAVASACSAGDCPDLVHRALERLLDCGASSDQLRSMSAVACKLLSRHPHRRLYERWKRLANSAKDLEPAEAPAASELTGTPGFLLKNPALVARYGTEQELLELYSAAELAWDTSEFGGHDRLFRSALPILTEDFLDGLSASKRLSSASDLHARLLWPMASRRGLPVDITAVPRLVDLLNKLSPSADGRRWTAQPVSLSDVLTSESEATSSTIRARSCPACGCRFPPAAYRPEPTEAEVANLLAAVSRVLTGGAGQPGPPAVLAAYRRWLAETSAANGPFDLVVDTSNLLLHRGRLVNTQWALLEKLRFQHGGIGAISLFQTAAADDLFALHAALSSGPHCHILSNDTYRDHSYLAWQRHEFVDWQLARHIFFRAPATKGAALPPLGSPQRSDVPELTADNQAQIGGPMHLLTALPKSATESEEGLVPELGWHCVRLES